VGNLTSIARPNGVTTQIAYDARRRMISLTDRAAGGAILAGETYTLDALGHRTSADRHDGSRLEYEYDVLGRVTRERHLDSGAVVTFESVYAYDAAGNLVASGPPGTPVTYAYNANNQLLSGGGVTFTYDGAGRRVREAWTPPGGPLQSVEYTWDARDRLASYRDAAGATTTYAYDSRGTRVAKDGADGPLDFLVDRENATGYSQIVRQDGLGLERSFVYGTRLLQAVDGGVRQFPLVNNIGSARALTGPAGEVTDAFDYQAYGELLTQTGTSALPHRFAGEESDPESGLTYLRARYHDPRTGAFLTRDPLAGNEGDPLSQHRYLYAAGNPVNRTDPSGRQSLPEVLVSSYQRLQAAGQHVLRARRGLAKAKDVTAITMRTLGGVLAVDAIIETMSNRSRVQRWFGGGVLGSAYDLAELGGALTGAVEVIATVGLGRTAIDMLNGRTIVFTIQGFGTISSSEPGQLMQAGKNESYSALCSNATTARAFAVSPVVQGQAWGIHLCASFFTQTPMPTAENLTAQGRSSMPGLMVHEFTHISLRTGDRAYQCSFSYRDDANRSRLGVGATAIVPGLNLTIADSYRCWVEDAAVGGAGNPNTPGPFGP
jgi:RHS repeat-associated protein